MGTLPEALTSLYQRKTKRRFKCFCDDKTREKDTAHGGTLRHFCGDSHIKATIEREQPGISTKDKDKLANELAWAKLPKVYSKLRKLNTTQYLAAKAKRETEARAAAAVAAMTVTGDAPSPAPAPSPVAFAGLAAAAANGL